MKDDPVLLHTGLPFSMMSQVAMASHNSHLFIIGCNMVRSVRRGLGQHFRLRTFCQRTSLCHLRCKNVKRPQTMNTTRIPMLGPQSRGPTCCFTIIFMASPQHSTPTQPIPILQKLRTGPKAVPQCHPRWELGLH